MNLEKQSKMKKLNKNIANSVNVSSLRYGHGSFETENKKAFKNELRQNLNSHYKSKIIFMEIFNKTLQ